jgi:hypothetical protein
LGALVGGMTVSFKLLLYRLLLLAWFGRWPPFRILICYVISIDSNGTKDFTFTLAHSVCLSIFFTVPIFAGIVIEAVKEVFIEMTMLAG